MCNMNNENIETVFEVGIPARGLSRSLRGLGASNEQAQHPMFYLPYQFMLSVRVAPGGNWAAFTHGRPCR